MKVTLKNWLQWSLKSRVRWKLGSVKKLPAKVGLCHQIFYNSWWIWFWIYMLSTFSNYFPPKMSFISEITYRKTHKSHRIVRFLAPKITKIDKFLGFSLTFPKFFLTDNPLCFYREIWWHNLTRWWWYRAAPPTCCHLL